MTPLAPAAPVFLGLLVMLAGAWDIRWRRIPNWLTVPGVAFGIALNVLHRGMDGLWFGLAGFAAALGVYLALHWLLPGRGMGDVKLMAAVGATAGASNWLVVFAFTAVAGGVLAMILVLSAGRLGTTLKNIGGISAGLVRLRRPAKGSAATGDMAGPKAMALPHGVAIALGTWLFLLAI